MKYYSKEYCENEKVKMTAGEKARTDLDTIVESLGYQELAVNYSKYAKNEAKNPISKFIKQVSIYKSFKAAFSRLKQGDTLFIQFPTMQTTIFFKLLINYLNAKGVSSIVLIHDLQSLRHGKLANTSIFRKLKTKLVEIVVLQGASKVIVHSHQMAETLVAMGVDARKLVVLGIFDYLIPDFDISLREGKTGKNKPVIVAGNLRAQKAAYVYNLPTNCDFNLYGVDFTGRLHGSSKYYGVFPPTEIPYQMEGSFGLVWDGRLAETCSDTFGEYLRINCPHKTSLYLASGIPVAIWSQASLADFIVKNKVGITVDSLYDLHGAIDRVSEEEYAEMLKNAKRVGKKLRDGAYTKEALNHC